jgi:hypothetical protein
MHTIKTALKDRDKLKMTEQAIHKELRQLLKGGCLVPRIYNELSKRERRIIVNAHLFLKDKYLSDDSFDKRNARLVANGNEEDIDDIGETTSPAVNPISVFTQLNLAAVNFGTTISSYDIESAFTITPVDSEKLNGKRKYVRVRSDIIKYFLEVDPTLAQYVTSNGDIVFELAY